MFNKQNFCHVASNNRNEQKAGIFVYRTTDNLQTVTTPGYFNEKLVDINLHDLIIHEQTDNADKTKVVYNILCVTERTLDNVGTQTILTDWEKALVVPTKLSDLTGDVSIVNPTNGQQLVYNSTTQKWENAAGGSGLPDQTGNAGKVLITDGTNASWTDNYLPLSGGTMTGIITYATSGTTGDTATKILSNTDNRDLIRAGAFGSMWVGSGTTYIASPCPTASGNSLGSNIMYWGTVYARKLNRGANSADINIPNQAGTMVVADYTDATEGQVLTLDSNLDAVWADAPTGLPDTTGATQGQVLTLDSNLDPKWATQSDSSKSIDAEIVGTLTITDNSIVSGFGNANYLKIPSELEFSNNFEIGCAFSTTDISSAVLFFHSNVWGISIHTANSKLQVKINTQTINGTTTLSSNTKYYIKLTSDGVNYTLSLSTDGVNYTQEATDTITDTPNKSDYKLGASSTNATLYMQDYYIKQNGILVWCGYDAPGLHQRVAKGHEVIAFQAPSAGSNYRWYRLYADGWVEQGGYYTGVVNAGSSVSITLPIPMADANYIVLITGEQNSNNWSGASLKDSSRTTTRFDIFAIGSGSSDKINGASWQVSGMAAS